MKKKVIIILSVSMVLALAAFVAEMFLTKSQTTIFRNSYGQGKKTQEYTLSIDGEEVEGAVKVEVGEREYSYEEVQEVFQKVTDELDVIILGENESFDRVEKDLHFVTEIEGYPVSISWQTSAYSVISAEGKVEEELAPAGTTVEIRGTITYGKEQALYVRTIKVYPLTRTGSDKLLYDIKQDIKQREEDTREEASFELPRKVNGKELTWSQKSSHYWLAIVMPGIVLSLYLLYKERKMDKRKKELRKKELLRDYPGMISKFTMLLGTGVTVKQAFEKIVENYERQKEQMGSREVYEEMKRTIQEMKGGIAEAEAYDRFGKRCGITVYMKFGALLVQNLRKGSKGISEVLRIEAIQSFEQRKSAAKRVGEEAGTKLMLPMFGMLAVVFIIVMVPAFLSI